MRFGAWLEEALEDRRLSRKQLAHTSRIDVSIISQLVDGYRGATPQMVRDIARGLRIDPGDAFRAWLGDDWRSDEYQHLFADPETVTFIAVFQELDAKNRAILHAFAEKLVDAQRRGAELEKL